jgi:hypothetical protein
MFRKLAGAAVLGLLFCATAVLAEEIRGKVTKVDDSANKITISVDGKDTEYSVASDCKMPKSKDGKERETLKSLAKRVEKSKDGGVGIVATTTKKDGKEVVTEIKMGGMRKKKDKTDAQ